MPWISTRVGITLPASPPWIDPKAIANRAPGVDASPQASRQLVHHTRRVRDQVDRAVGTCRVPSGPLEDEGELVGARRDRAGSASDAARRQSGIDVKGDQAL